MKKYLLTLLLLAGISLPALSRDFTYTYEGKTLTYTVISETDKTCKTKEGRESGWSYSSAGNNVSGNLVIPEIADGYTVIELGKGGFYKSSLTSVEIPNSVTTIGELAFGDCKGLKKAQFSSIESLCKINFDGPYSNPLHDAHNLYIDGENITEVIIPESITTLKYTFSGCSLTSVKIPNSVTSIGQSCFEGCKSLTSIEIPNSVTSLGNYCFNYCSSLTSIDIPNSVTTIGDCCFKDCSSLTSIEIPNSVTSLGSNCFYYCKNLTSIEIPNSVTSLGSWCFKDCSSLTSLIIPESVIEIGSSAFSGCTLNPLLIKNDKGIAVSSSAFDGLDKNSFLICPIWVFGRTNDIECKTSVYPFEIQYTPLIGGVKIKIGELNEILKDVWPEKYQYFKDAKYYLSDEWNSNIPKFEIRQNEEYLLKNLRPDRSYWCYLYINGGEGLRGIQLNSLPIEVKEKINVFPTSVVLNADINAGYCSNNISETYWTFNGEKYTGTPTITGLNPRTSYTLNYTVKYKEGWGSETYTFDKTTSDLELNILQPKCTTSTTAILGASTNISDEETGVGFQWKKYDAPASLKPSEAYAPVYDGMIEGYVKNLQPSSYYNVRAFYKNAEGTYYYTDWVTFDPSDFSYFEPTVHTYPIAEVSGNSVTMHGYALQGSDDIISQGFTYQYTGSGTQAHTLSPTSGTITASGQVMTATLTDLPNGEYTYKAFVKTAAGYTYGEPQTFIIDVVGVENVEIDRTDAKAEIVGYYDLNGRRYTAPQRGFNIVVYSDGRTEKLIRR